jgi:hypothetical protein
MPQVGKKKFPYTLEGKADAEMARAKKNKKSKAMKKTGKKK